MVPRADALGILDGDIGGRDHPLRRSDQPGVTGLDYVLEASLTCRAGRSRAR